MQNNEELEEMFNDSEEKFTEWGNQEISFFGDLTREEKDELRASYENAEKLKETWDKTMSIAISQTENGIDYSTDIDKSAAKWDQAKQNLEVKIDKLSEKYGRSK